MVLLHKILRLIKTLIFIIILFFLSFRIFFFFFLHSKTEINSVYYKQNLFFPPRQPVFVLVRFRRRHSSETVVQRSARAGLGDDCPEKPGDESRGRA